MTVPNDAFNHYSSLLSRSHDAAMRFYDTAGNVIETYDHARQI